MDLSVIATGINKDDGGGVLRIAPIHERKREVEWRLKGPQMYFKRGAAKLPALMRLPPAAAFSL